LTLIQETEENNKMDYKKNLIRNIAIAGTTCAAGLWATSAYLPSNEKTEDPSRILLLSAEGERYRTGAPGTIVADNEDLTVFRRSIDGVTYENAENQRETALAYSVELEANGTESVGHWRTARAQAQKRDFSGLRKKLKQKRAEALEGLSTK